MLPFRLMGGLSHRCRPLTRWASCSNLSFGVILDAKLLQYPRVSSHAGMVSCVFLLPPSHKKLFPQLSIAVLKLLLTTQHSSGYKECNTLHPRLRGGGYRLKRTTSRSTTGMGYAINRTKFFAAMVLQVLQWK